EKTRGAAILLPKSSPLQVERQIRDQEGRILVLEVSLLGTRTALANIYAPNTSDPRFYASLEALSQEVQDLPLIIGGDFNQVIDPILDRSAHDREAIRGIMRDKELVEIWRLIHPQASDFTFKSGCHGTKSQIDFFFLSQSMVEQVSSCDIGIRALTDHAPVDLVIHWGDSQTARGRWHMNVSLVNNPAIREKLAAVIRDYLEINTGSVTSFSTLWEAGKAFLRGHIEISARKKREDQDAIQVLESEIVALEKAYDELGESETLHLLLEAKFALNTHFSKAAEFPLFKESGERAGKLLASLIKKQEAKRSIPCIKSKEGNVLTELNKIQAELQEFYSSLYTSECPTDVCGYNRFLGGLDLPSLTSPQKEKLDAPIQLQEICQAIKSMANGKAPGED
uniref:Endonuclease/exonuclease/phosphatase domain-containing protein n=1 Tax=Latimeria chalumnae TaxID=7897 RepID=H3AMF5_LATCH